MKRILSVTENTHAVCVSAGRENNPYCTGTTVFLKVSKHPGSVVLHPDKNTLSCEGSRQLFYLIQSLVCFPLASFKPSAVFQSREHSNFCLFLLNTRAERKQFEYHYQNICINLHWEILILIVEEESNNKGGFTASILHCDHDFETYHWKKKPSLRQQIKT